MTYDIPDDPNDPLYVDKFLVFLQTKIYELEDTVTQLKGEITSLEQLVLTPEQREKKQQMDEFRNELLRKAMAGELRFLDDDDEDEDIDEDDEEYE